MWHRTAWLNMVSLSPDELILFQSPAKYHGTKGTFFLTNKKVTFDYEQRGIIFKGKYTALNLPLEKYQRYQLSELDRSKNLR
jgi:hypothetical protein